MKLRDMLKGTIPEEVLQYVSNHFDVIGDVAILSLPEELSSFKKVIASAIISHRRNIYTVLNKVRKVSGDVRTASYEILEGDTTVALHREFSFHYRLDVSKVFFSVHMAYERMRIIDQIEPGEEVLVPFCGVGPFAIPAAAKGANVIAIENNPDAVVWLNENIGLNKVRRNIRVIEADAFDTTLLAGQRFDRIIIPTPYGMDRIFEVLSPLVKQDGMIHFFTFKRKPEIPGLIENFRKTGYGITFFRSCGNVAPGVSRWVFDLERDF